MTTQPDFRALCQQLVDAAYAFDPQLCEIRDCMGQADVNLLYAIRDAGAALNTPPLAPIPVSERPILRKDRFNDGQGRCWCGTVAFTDETGDRPVEHACSWELREPCAQDDCVMPHWAIPLPEESSCHASKDGECFYDACPQLRDNEPSATGRHCPLDNSTGESE